jgi:hypothetical protein
MANGEKYPNISDDVVDQAWQSANAANQHWDSWQAAVRAHHLSMETNGVGSDLSRQTWQEKTEAGINFELARRMADVVMSQPYNPFDAKLYQSEIRSRELDRVAKVLKQLGEPRQESLRSGLLELSEYLLVNKGCLIVRPKPKSVLSVYRYVDGDYCTVRRKVRDVAEGEAFSGQIIGVEEGKVCVFSNDSNRYGYSFSPFVVLKSSDHQRDYELEIQLP